MGWTKRVFMLNKHNKDDSSIIGELDFKPGIYVDYEEGIYTLFRLDEKYKTAFKESFNDVTKLWDRILIEWDIDNKIYINNIKRKIEFFEIQIEILKSELAKKADSG